LPPVLTRVNVYSIMTNKPDAILNAFANDFEYEPDYLSELARAETIGDMARLVRAFGCRISARALAYTDAQEVVNMLRAHERAAYTVEHARDIHHARNILRDLGYGSLVVDTDPGMPPPDVMEAFAKDCHCCRECSAPPCDEVMAAGVCPRRCSCEEEYDDRCTDPDGHEWYEGAPDRMDEGPIRCIHCGADGDS